MRAASATLAHAAFRRAFWAKGTDNHTAAWLNSAGNLSDVSNTALGCRKEMENRSVMQQIVGMWFQLDFDDIAGLPTHLLRGRTQSPFRDFDCSLRDVQYG